MKNSLDIHYKHNLAQVFKSSLESIEGGVYYGNETANGLKMAIDYLDSLMHEYLTEKEMRHVLRISTYRGSITDYRELKSR